MTDRNPAGQAPHLSRQWLWVAAIWCGVALIDATQNVFVMRAEGMHHAWIRLFFFLSLSWLTWGFATPLVLWMGRRYPPVRVLPLHGWWLHLAVCLAIGIITATWAASLEMLMDPWANPSPPGPFVDVWFDKFFGGVISFLVLYATILAIGYALDARERLALQLAEAARLNEQLALAQLDALRRQIEPHFLFNALNTIAGLVREQKGPEAISMIAGVSDLLRRVLDESDRHLVSLGEELGFLQKYFDIQKMRFGARVQITVAVPDELRSAPVPSLILLPMAENAFKHGVEQRIQAGVIRIAASYADNMLTLSVYNDGPALPATVDQSKTGIGFANARERLQGLYGDRFSLTMQNREDGVEVLIALPFRPA